MANFRDNFIIMIDGIEKNDKIEVKNIQKSYRLLTDQQIDKKVLESEKDKTVKYLTLIMVILLSGCTNISLENTYWFSRFNKYSNDYYFGRNGTGTVKMYGGNIIENDDEYFETNSFNYLFDGKKLKIIFQDHTDEYSLKTGKGNKVFISDFEYVYGREWLNKEILINNLKEIKQNNGKEVTIIGTYKKAFLNQNDKNTEFYGQYKIEVNDSLSIILYPPYDEESKRSEEEIKNLEGKKVKVIGTIIDKTYLNEPSIDVEPQTVSIPCFIKIRFIKLQ
jgi:hypothetical protein